MLTGKNIKCFCSDFFRGGGCVKKSIWFFEESKVRVFFSFNEFFSLLISYPRVTNFKRKLKEKGKGSFFPFLRD